MMYNSKTTSDMRSHITSVICLLTLLCATLTMPVAAKSAENWHLWQHFKQNLISKDGRVIDYSNNKAITTSEGQSYAMFFALIANEPEQFDKLYRWTQNNLANGDLSKNLPAWLWGKKVDQNQTHWQILDSNSASDSDLWIAYCLLEAGRLWQNQHYHQTGLALAQQILDKETAEIPQLGLSLLPAPVGFTPTDKSWKLNPSYVPLQLLRAVHQHSKNEKWLQLVDASQRLIIDTSPKGFTPDWVIYQQDKGFETTSLEGSYNAIRTYLWAGMLHPDDPLRDEQLRQLNPMAIHVAQHNMPPEHFFNQTGETKGSGPIGFSTALLPFLQANQAYKALSSQLIRLHKQPLSEIPQQYYNQVLSLFALAFIEDRYYFAANGLLITPWSGKKTDNIPIVESQ